MVHKMEIRALKDEVIKVLEERHYEAAVEQMNNLEMDDQHRSDQIPNASSQAVSPNEANIVESLEAN